jgi:hypothetical protein
MRMLFHGVMVDFTINPKKFHGGRFQKDVQLNWNVTQQPIQPQHSQTKHGNTTQFCDGSIVTTHKDWYILFIRYTLPCSPRPKPSGAKPDRPTPTPSTDQTNQKTKGKGGSILSSFETPLALCYAAVGLACKYAEQKPKLSLCNLPNYLDHQSFTLSLPFFCALGADVPMRLTYVRLAGKCTAILSFTMARR